MLTGLTLWQPWAFIVSHKGKNIENRPKKPPKAWAQTKPLIAIHAGKRYDEPGAQWLKARGCEWDDTDIVHSAIVAVVRVVGYVTESDSRWYIPGQIGWLLEDIQPIIPVACGGMQGLWPLPQEVEEAVRKQLNLPSPPIPQSPQGTLF